MTPDFNERAGSFLRVDFVGGDWYSLEVSEASVIANAVRNYRERGIDSLIEADDRNGFTVHLVASQVVSFYPCTPESRASSLLEEIQQEEWETAFRKQHAAKEWEA